MNAHVELFLFNNSTVLWEAARRVHTRENCVVNALRRGDTPGWDNIGKLRRRVGRRDAK